VAYAAPWFTDLILIYLRENINYILERMAQLPACFIDLILIYLRENINYIEERMAQLVPHSIPLRLTCLLAHCGDGLAGADLARLKTQLVQAYGFQHLLTWSNLLKLGLIKPKVLFYAFPKVSCCLL
jgi:hypothetical protein